MLSAPPAGYSGPMTYEALTKAGVPLLAYGNFVTVVINFIILAFVIFWMVRQFASAKARLDAAPAPPPPCPARKCCCCGRSGIRFAGSGRALADSPRRSPTSAARSPRCPSLPQLVRRRLRVARSTSSRRAKGRASCSSSSRAARSASCATASSRPRRSSTFATWSLAGGEQGLLGLALHPDFAANGRFFVNYTRARRRRDGDRVVHASAPAIATSPIRPRAASC